MGCAAIKPEYTKLALCSGPLGRGRGEGLVCTVSRCANIYQNLSIFYAVAPISHICGVCVITKSSSHYAVVSSLHVHDVTAWLCE